jgi:peptide deformylase
MAILNVIRFPNPILRKKCKAIRRVEPAIKKLAKDMVETMHAAPGVGLAAPQVGESIQLIVVDIGQGPIILINPKIVKKGGRQTFVEGCLCLPGIEAPVERAAYTEVKGLNEDGQPVDYIAEGYLATVFQHEIDHLEGKVFIDRVKDPALIRDVRNKTETKEDTL